MMQHVTQEKTDDTKELTTIEIEQDQTPLSDSEPSVENHQGLLSKESNFGPDMSGSEDDEASEVDSFFLEEAELKEGEYVPEQSKYLLPAESVDTQPLRTVDPETHARLEALLEAAGISKLSSKDGKALTDPEVLRTLTSSVSSALDEAAQALHRMRAEQQSHLSSNECARSLAEACGEDVNIRKLCDSNNVPEPTEEGESLLSLACSAGYYELAQVLLAMKANVEDRGIKGDCTPLMEAASGGHVDIVRLLISHGADVDAQSSAGNTPLHYASCGGFTEVVQEIIKANARVEVHNENGHTPLMEAASAGHVEVARILLDNGAGINTHSNEFKESALTLACYKGHLEMVKFLLEAGADQEHKTDEMHTALMEASMDGHVEVARLLLDSGAQVNMPADSFESPLTLAACGGHVDLASLLIERGANIEEVNDEGYTPLMEAAREGHDEMVVLLLSHNAYINGQTEETQETALTLACCGGFLEVADFLIQAGADIELGCSTPLMEAAQEGHLELVNYLLKSKAKVHAQTGTGDTALTYACENGHTDVAEILLEHGAELEHESEGGRTPLMKAARAGHLCTVQFLIRKGADVNRSTTTNDHTVLSLACAGGHLAVVELLLAHASDSSHKLKDGSTMVIEAAKGGHTQVVKLLLEWPNHHLVSSPEHVQLTSNDPNLDEPRVPVQGLANIVPPSEPDSLPPKANFSSTFSGVNQAKSTDQVRQNIQKTLAKRCLNGGGEGKLAKPSNTVIAEGLHQPSHDGGFLTELGDEKATEKVEAIINNIMAKELINTTTATKEEQIQRKQQILEELQKVERELQEKAQAQLLLSAQQQLEQHQQQLLAQTATKAKNVSQGKGQTEEGKKKADGSGQPQNILDFEATPDLQLANDITSQLPKELTAITQSLLPHYTEAFLRQNNMLNQNNGAMTAAQENRNLPPGSQTQDVMQSSVTSQMTMDAVQRQQLQVLAQQQHLQPLSFPQLQLTTQQQEQLLQHVLSQPSYQQQLSANQQFAQPLSQQALQLLPHALPQQQQQALQVQAQQLLSQQQQQQFLQQQQQAQHLLQQQQLNQLKQPVNPNNKQPRKVRPNQNPADEVPIPPTNTAINSPPPSTPMTPNPSPASPQNLTPLYSSVDVDAETESNHDTALTLACAGGHAELVNLLLLKGSDIEHRDKKGFTPLILAATAGHVDVVEILLDHNADIEAQSERTKDTPLSLACSGGRYEVVELLLAKGANKEHRNVSDYTPLSLAASGGYVNIIKLLLSHGAEINSRTGSKLGISPLMLAAMNGHTAAVKLLLDMGSDINAQIETNRNTALTLACFQGRHEVVSLLVDRKANIEHRAKTGLTPLMEAASGGYVEVGRVLLERGADVNAPPVPSSRDTALTIAADKGHYRFVELLLNRGASVDVKNKKGNSPLWLACNGGHLDVVQLLVSAGADIDSQDNRKVSCLMAAFRKGHVKVVKWMVKHVSQFPSDTELQRYIATVNDKELQKKCQQCMETIVTAKDRQAAEANKNATILLEEIDKERQVEENRKAQAAKKRERRKRKRKEKLEKEKESSSKNSSPEPESAEAIEYNEVEDIVPEELPPPPPIIEIKTETISTNQEPKPGRNKPNKNVSVVASSNSLELKKNKKNRSRDRDRDTPPSDIGSPRVPAIVCNVTTIVTPVVTTSTVTVVVSPSSHGHSNHHRERNRERTENRKKKNDFLIKPVSTTAIGDLDEFGTIPDNMKMSEREIQKLTKSVEKMKINNVQQSAAFSTSDKVSSVETSPNTLSLKGSPVVASPKRGAKKEEGWKEVVRKSKRVPVPSGAISRVIGRGGCNINAIREVSGAHVEVEKQKGSGDRTITIKGSADSTRQAQALIMALVQEPDKELTEIIARGKVKPPEKAPSVVTIGDFAIGTFSVTSPGSNDPPPSQVYSQSGSSNKSSKNSAGNRSSGSNQVSNSAKSSGANGIPQSMIWQNPHPSQGPPSSPRRSPQKQLSSSNQGQTGSPVPGIGEKNVPRQLFPDRRNSTSPVATFTNTTVSYSTSSSTMKIVTTSATLTTSRGVSLSSAKLAKNPVPGSIKVLQRPQSIAAAKSDPQPLPIVTSHVNSMNNVGSQLTSPSVTTPGDYTPFKNFFNSTYILSKKEESSDKMNFASVAAAGVVSTLATSHTVATVAAALSSMENKIDPALQAKAPGYKPGRTSSPQFRQDQEPVKTGFRNFQLPLQNETDMTRTPGFRGSIPGMSPRSNPSTPSGLSPRSQTGTPLDLSQHSLSLSSASSQKDEYSMPNQPMTLPEIKSTLNPNAPDFQLAASNMGPIINGVPIGMPLNFPPSQSLSGLPPGTLQALQQQLFNAQQQLMNNSSFNNMPPQPGNFIPPTGMNQSEQNFNIMQQMASQLSQQMASQGMQAPSPAPGPGPGGQGPSQGQNPNPVQGFPQMMSRNLSPMPPHPRPNSAPSMSVMQADGPGPIGPPKAPSPMPPCTPPLNDAKNTVDDRRVPRPIGGERSHRKAPGPSGGNIAGVGEYSKLWALNAELNSEWTPTTSPLMSSATIPASVITSSVITGGNMAYDVNSAQDVDCPPAENPDGNSFSDSLPVDPATEHNFQNPPVMMPMFPNGVPGHYPVPPMFNPRVGGDTIPSMWNSTMKAPPSEAVEAGSNWTWSQQTDI